jgi:hypothetical protein
MKKLEIPYFTDTLAVNEFFDQQSMHKLDEQLFFLIPDPPKTEFLMCYSDSMIYLKYKVSEKSIRASHTTINAPVYEDSCVEFFIKFGNDQAYYNFEFNCIGIPLAGYGKDKERALLPFEVVEMIQRKSVIRNNQTSSDINWELTIGIPFQVFTNNQVDSLQGKTCTGNFYKCGDCLDNPHYLAWNYVQSEVPNFHLPQYFGQLLF